MSKNSKNKLLVVLEGPSGVGKDTVMKGLMECYPGVFARIISYSTRPMRADECQGNPYYFIDDKTFDGKVKSGDIFEHTTRHGTKRGMSKALIDQILDNNQIPLKDCDYIGITALKKVYGNNVFGIFLTAPKQVIEQRLKNRGDCGVDLENRLKNYEEHLKQKVYYDVEISNIDLEQTIKNVYNSIVEFKNKINTKN